MSSTANTTSDNPSSSRVQSANKSAKQETPTENNHTATDKTSRPPSASLKPVNDVSVPADANGGTTSDTVAAVSEEPVLTATTSPTERPSSANTQPKTDTNNVSRPASAAVNGTTNDAVPESTTAEVPTSRPPSTIPNGSDLTAHGYTIDTTPRPPSVAPKEEQPTVTTSSRPASAAPKANEPTENSAPTTSNSRPPSANQNSNPTNTPGSRPSSAATKSSPANTAGSRPQSATVKSTAEPTITNSRPSSAIVKSNLVTPTGSRPSSASQRTDMTKVSENNETNAPSNSRPASAAKLQSGSRPPSANKGPVIAPAADYTVEKNTDPVLLNTDDSDATEPIIGRPPSAAKQTPTDETKIMISVEANGSESNSKEDLTSVDENKPAETNGTTSRAGSASKKPPTSEN